MPTMTRTEAVDFLAVGTRTGDLATASPQGAPHVAPVWFVVDGDDLVFTTSRDSIKGRHLRANPSVARLMGTRARERVLREHTWPHVVSRCLDAYRA